VLYPVVWVRPSGAAGVPTGTGGGAVSVEAVVVVALACLVVVAVLLGAPVVVDGGADGAGAALVTVAGWSVAV
jgi:hypothetical protein